MFADVSLLFDFVQLTLLKQISQLFDAIFLIFGGFPKFLDGYFFSKRRQLIKFKPEGVVTELYWWKAFKLR